MATNNNQSTRVEDVLARIEKRERSRSLRKRLILGTLAIGLIGGSALGFSALAGRSDEMEVWAYRDLSEDRLQAMLTSNAAGILVQHPDLGTETIRSLADYQRINETVMLAQRLDEMQSSSAEVDSAQTLETFYLDIAGERRAGESLVFRIENYDPEVDYLLDLGNGQRRKVGEQLTYRYPLQGNFELRLLASKGEASSVYTKRFRIAAPLRQNEEPQRSPEPEQQPAQPDQIASSEEGVTSTEATAEDAEEVATLEPVEVDPNLFAAKEATPMDFAASQRRSNEPVDANMPRGAQPSRAEREQPEANDEIVSSPLLASEVAPTFPGGSDAMMRFIQRNYSYPRGARDVGIEGTVVIRFVVNADGSLSDFTLVKGIGGGCDDEAMRIVRAMPNWIPGKQGNQNVPVYKTIPITFRLLD